MLQELSIAKLVTNSKHEQVNVKLVVFLLMAIVAKTNIKMHRDGAMISTTISTDILEFVTA